MYSDTVVFGIPQAQLKAKGCIQAVPSFPNFCVVATVTHVLKGKQAFPTDLLLLTARFQSCV